MKKSRESGFAMLLVFLMAATIAITLYLEIPRVAFKAQRQKEQLLIERGEQYKRAIQLFVRVNGRYPGDLKDLENFNNRRFLRHKFIEHWRRHRCQARHNITLARTIPPADGRVTPALRELDPARAAEYNDLLDHFCRRLRVEDRRMVVMRLQGYRTGEIAAELGIAPAVLRVRLSRLRPGRTCGRPMPLGRALYRAFPS